MRDTEIGSRERLLRLYLALPHTPSRRCLRDPALQPLQPIRSLHYFLPVIEEVLRMEISPDYVRYLRRKLAAFVSPDLFSD